MHPLVVEVDLLLVLPYLVKVLSTHGTQSHSLTYLIRLESVLAIEVKTEHIAIRNTVGQRIFM